MALSQLFWDVLMSWNLKSTYFSLKMIHFLSLNIWYVIYVVFWIKYWNLKLPHHCILFLFTICTVSQLFWNQVCIYIYVCVCVCVCVCDLCWQDESQWANFPKWVIFIFTFSIKRLKIKLSVVCWNRNKNDWSTLVWSRQSQQTQFWEKIIF